MEAMNGYRIVAKRFELLLFPPFSADVLGERASPRWRPEMDGVRKGAAAICWKEDQTERRNVR